MSAHDSALLDYGSQPLEAFVHEPGCWEGVEFLSLHAGTKVNVFTRYSCYRLVVLDPDERLARVEGGRMFEESTEVRIEGATAGGSAIKSGWIGIGLRLEMSTDSKRVTTSVVQSITIDPPPPSRVC